MPEFDATKFRDCFQEILTRHNECKPRLLRMRRLFRGIAEDMAKMMRSKMCAPYSTAGYGHVLTGYPRPGSLPNPCNHSEAELKRAIGGTSIDCGKNIFDPWDSSWQGKYSFKKQENGRPAPTSDQYHIWDKTRKVGEQWVQPVTQSETGFANGSNLAEKKEQKKTDLAINVWDEECGVTGWVSKHQNNNREEWILIGYCIKGRLIWIAQRLDPTTKEPVKADEYFLFYEWVESTRYGILGRRFKIENGKPKDDHGSNEEHVGVYQKPLSQIISDWIDDFFEWTGDLFDRIRDVLRRWF